MPSIEPEWVQIIFSLVSTWNFQVSATKMLRMPIPAMNAAHYDIMNLWKRSRKEICLLKYFYADFDFFIRSKL